MSNTAENRRGQLGNHQALNPREFLALTAMTATLLASVGGALPQLQMFLLGGHMLTNVFAKVTLVVALVLGLLARPRTDITGLPIVAFAIAIGYLILDVGYLITACRLSPSDIWQSYNGYYAYFFLAFGCVAFRGMIPERLLIRYTVFSLVICACIGIAQHFTGRPLLYTESLEGNFIVQSWEFFESVRAFSLFSSGLDFGAFCALCGALGVAMSRKHRLQGVLITALSALACYTTLTRVAYLLFFGACMCSAVITFGKDPKRGFWQPLVYLLVGAVTMVLGLRSFATDDTTTDLQSASSVFERLVEWTYYTDQLMHSSLDHQLFGLGIVQGGNDSTVAPIDNVPLSLILHIGIVGMVIFCTLLFTMWLFLRREALTRQQPFIIAVASMWATLACEGLFQTLLSQYGCCFALALLCSRHEPSDQDFMQPEKG